MIRWYKWDRISNPHTKWYKSQDQNMENPLYNKKTDNFNEI